MSKGGKKKGFYYAQTMLQQQNDSDIAVQYEVQRILNHRLKKKFKKNYFYDNQITINRNLVNIPNTQLEFYVRWKGYGSDYQTWEPGENLQNAPAIVEEYKHSVSNSSKQRRTNNSARARERESRLNGNEAENGRLRKPERKTRGLRFDRIYAEDRKVKLSDFRQDELCFIDEDDFLQEITKTKVTKNRKHQHDSVSNGTNRNRRQRKLQLQYSSQEEKPKPDSLQQNGQDYAFEVYIQAVPIALPELQANQNQNKIVENNLLMTQQQNQVRQKPAEQASKSQNSSLLSRLSSQEWQKIASSQLGYFKTANTNQPKLQNTKHISDEPQQQQPNKRTQRILQSIFNDLESEQQQKQIGYQEREQLEQQFLAQQNQIWDKLDLNFAESNQHLFNNQASLQNYHVNNKRQKTFDYDPQQTGQKIAKRIKSNTFIHATQNIVCENGRRSQTPQPVQVLNHIHPLSTQKNVELVQNQPAQAFHQPIQIDITDKVAPHLQKYNQKQDYEKQMQSLYLIQPINLLDSQSQTIGIPKNQNQNPPNTTQYSQSTPKTCPSCSQKAHSYDLLLQYRKHQLIQINEFTCDAILQKIYEQQQIYICVNDLKPSSDIQKQDRIKKLIILQNKPFIQNAIARRAVNIEDLDEIIQLYVLCKIVRSKADWYGIFKAGQLMREKSNYKYVRIRDLAKCCKAKIVEYLTNKE